MAVSKRTRFEVLRRDNYTCRYCRNTDAPLTVDHVTPVALGGSDDPSNLVAACKDCNAGKSSSSPEATLVSNVEDDAIRWASAIEKAAEIRRGEADSLAHVSQWFKALWLSAAGQFADLPGDWAESVITFVKLGLTTDDLERAVRRAANRPGVAKWQAFRYFAGICWSEVREMQEMARALLAAEDADA